MCVCVCVCACGGRCIGLLIKGMGGKYGSQPGQTEPVPSSSLAAMSTPVPCSSPCCMAMVHKPNSLVIRGTATVHNSLYWLMNDVMYMYTIYSSLHL